MANCKCDNIESRCAMCDMSNYLPILMCMDASVGNKCETIASLNKHGSDEIQNI
jgi:hypothetical protein